jgi:hypothetical protein
MARLNSGSALSFLGQPTLTAHHTVRPAAFAALQCRRHSYLSVDSAEGGVHLSLALGADSGRPRPACPQALCSRLPTAAHAQEAQQ